MFAIRLSMLACLVAVAAFTTAARAQRADERLYRAHYLETAARQGAEAARLYAEIADDPAVDRAIRAEARTRLAIVREQIAATDFARLMPPTALAYVELTQPGQQLESLLEQLGLMRAGDIRAIGQSAARPARPEIAISPALVRSLLDVRGVAAAVTGFDPVGEKPTGVAVFHPGSLDLVRGLIETALPASGQAVEPIEGYPTYALEDEALVTLTNSLVIVSPQRHEIAGVIERMQDPGVESLATSSHMGELLAQREGGLLFFAVSFEPVMPLLQVGLAAAVDQEAAAALRMLDLQSLRSLVGQFGVNDDGLFLDAALRLDESHRNLAFNLLRLPPLDRQALQRVPAGAAGLVAFALNERREPAAAPDRDGDAPPPISLMDYGREVFDNVVGVTAFVIPPAGERPRDDDVPPDAAVVISVNDPARSRALWTMTLDLASAASGAAPSAVVQVGAAEARRYALDEIELYLATSDDEVILATSRAAIEATLATRQGGASALDDPAFAPAFERLGPHDTLAAFAHPARLLEVAAPYMSPRELREVRPLMEPMRDMVAAVVVTHSRHALRLRARLSGLPRLGGVLSELIEREQRGGGPGEFTRIAR